MVSVTVPGWFGWQMPAFLNWLLEVGEKGITFPGRAFPPVLNTIGNYFLFIESEVMAI